MDVNADGDDGDNDNFPPVTIRRRNPLCLVCSPLTLPPMSGNL